MAGRSCPICGDRGQVGKIGEINCYDMVMCYNCGFVFADISRGEVVESNFVVSDYIDELFTRNQTYMDALWFGRIAFRFRYLGHRCRVLDVGCGNGMLLRHFKAMGWHCFGLDVSPWARKYAKLYDYALYDREIEEDYLPENYFDLVVSTSTLEHVYDPYEHLKSIMRVLKPGGIVYIAGVPNFGSVSVKLGVSKFYFNTPPSHVNYFTPKSFYVLLGKIKKYYPISFRIRTYGIPESFYIYHKFKLLLEKKGKVEKMSAGVVERGMTSPQVVDYGKPVDAGRVWIAFGKLVIMLNYVLGRPFNLGDKIEVLIRKGC